MLEYVWVRFIAVSLLFGSYSIADLIARGLAGRNRIPKVRRPRWSHFLGFASVLFIYEAVFRDGRTLLGGTGNQIGFLLAVIAMVLRLVWSRGSPIVRYPDLAARMLFYASLPIVIGSPRAVVLFTVIQAAIAIQEALQRDEVLAASASEPAGASGAPRHRMIPGVW